MLNNKPKPKFSSYGSSIGSKEMMEEMKKKMALKKEKEAKKQSEPKPKIVVDTSTLEENIRELNGLTGLGNVKSEVKTLINYIKIQKERKKAGLKTMQNSYHCVFTGSPGTGKTTIARLLGKIYKNLGVIKSGHFIETDRSGLVSKYVGQTAQKVNEIVDAALDGVLYIDEAYSLIIGDRETFGEEALATLIKRMEDDRDRLVVIISGYTNEMKEFLASNPGLKSRFNRYVDFVDYSKDELYDIFEYQCNQFEYKLDNKAKEKITEVIGASHSQKDKSFGNGRFIRNIFEKCIERQSNRIAISEELNSWFPSFNKDKLSIITADDIPTERSSVDTNYLI